MNIIAYPALPVAYEVPRTPRLISALILHGTQGVKAGDLFTLSGRDPRHLVSVHYYVTKAGEVYQLVDDADIAYHAGVSELDGVGDVNRFSIGVEFENLQDGRDPFPPAQIAAGTDLARGIVSRNRIPQSRVKPHSAVALPKGRKTDPGPLFPLSAFLAALYPPTVDPNARRYTVGSNGAIVRQAKTPHSIEVARLAAGSPVWIKALVFGEAVDGSDVWAHLSSDAGFIHSAAAVRSK